MAWIRSHKKGSGGGVSGFPILSGTSDPTSSQGNDGQEYLKYVDYSETYTFKEYLEVGSTAGAYINTGYTVKNSNEFEFKAQWYDTPVANSYLFGVWQSNKDTNVGYYNSKVMFNVGASGTTSLILDTDPHIYKATRTDMLIDGTSIGKVPNWNNVPTLNYGIFCLNGSQYITNKARIYYAKIWDNGELVRHFVPAERNSDNVCGLLDIVNGVFYTNDGTQSFTAGNTSSAITGKPILSAKVRKNNSWQDLIGSDIDDITLAVGGVNILSGTSNPTSSQGINGQVYLKYVDNTSYTFTSFMNNKIIVRENLYDSTDKKLFFVGFTKESTDIQITDSDLLAYLSDITSGYKKASYSYSDSDGTTRNGNIGFWYNSGVYIRSWTANWAQLTSGTFYAVIDLNEAPNSSNVSDGQHNEYFDPTAISGKLINSQFVKVDGAWQNLTGEDIDNVTLNGGETPKEYTITQGETTSTSTGTVTLSANKYYLFNTVYGGLGFNGATIIIGNTSPIYTTSGIGRTGCIIRTSSDTVSYTRYGDVSDNEYTEMDVTDDSGISAIDDSWSTGTSISTTKNKFYFLALADGETGNIVGANVLVEHELEDTVSNGTRFLIVKSIAETIALDNGHSFYYRRIGLLL